jgi:hypothetical protein
VDTALLVGIAVLSVFAVTGLGVSLAARAAPAEIQDRLWPLPLLWIIVVPLVTVPWSSALVEGLQGEGSCYWKGGNVVCPVRVAVLTLAPGLLNLVPLVWLASPHPRVRRAALLATVLGASRLLVPIVVYVLSSWEGLVGMPGYGALGGYQERSTPSWGWSILLWFVSVGCLFVLTITAVVRGERRQGPR